MNYKRPLLDHRVIQIFGLESKKIWDYNSILPKVKEFSKRMDLKIIKESHHDFKPQGTTLIFVLSNSHLAIHTWPEDKYLHIDLVTCVPLLEDKKIKEIIKKSFNVLENQIKVRNLKYGN